MTEYWRPVPIPEFAALYEVSSAGKVRRNGRELKLRTNKRGYLYVYLRSAPVYRNITIHRLVALSFIPNPGGLPEVNHKDTIKLNCTMGNLEWSNRLGNHSHAVKSGIKMACIRKLSDESVAAIKAGYLAGAGQKHLANEYGVAQSTISRLVNGLRRANHGVEPIPSY